MQPPTPDPPPSPLHRALDAFGALVLRRRVSFAVATALLSLVMTGLATRVGVDFTVQEMFGAGDPDVAYLERFRRTFGPDDATVVVLVEADDVFSPKTLALVKRLGERLAALPAVEQVDSLATVSDLSADGDAIDTRPLLRQVPGDRAAAEALARRALASPILRRWLVSADRRVTAIGARLEPEVDRAPEIEAAVAEIERLVAGAAAPAGVRLRLFGIPRVRAEAVRLIKRDQLRFLPLGASLTLLVLLLLYRSLHGVALPLLAIGLSTIYTVGLMALLGSPLDILSNVLPLLVMVYGVADAVHLLGRVHEQMRAGDPRELAVRAAVRHLGVACLLTSATTAVGFGSLMTSGTAILRRFGFFAAAGVLLAYLVTMVVVPLGVSLLRVDPARTARVSTLAALDRLLEATARLCRRLARPLLLGGVALAAGGIYLGTRVEVDNYMLGIYDDDDETALATRLAERRLQGVVTLQVAISGAPGAIKRPAVLREIARLERWLLRQPGVTNTLSPAVYVAELHRAVVGQRKIPDDPRAVAQLLLMAEGQSGIERVVDHDYGQARVLALLRDIGAQRYLALVERLRGQLGGLRAAGVDVRLTGSSLIAYRALNRLVVDLMTSLAVALGIIAVLLALAFRSLRVGLISLLPNVVPLASGLAFMYATGMRLEPTTMMIYCIALGIAVDDTIHFVARYRECCQRTGDDCGPRANGRSGSPSAPGSRVGTARGCNARAGEAVTETLRTAGRAMVITSVVLIIGFSVTLTSGFPATQRFGQLGMVILATALVTDLLITPACLLVFRPWASDQRET